MTARAIMSGVRLGVFEALRDRPLTCAEIAAVCATDESATRSLLSLFVTLDYLRRSNGRFKLTPLSHKWLLAGGPKSIRDYMLFLEIIWDWTTEIGHYVKTGTPISYHDTFSPSQWDRYQRAMQAIARISANEAGRRTPVPRNAGLMLDIGGSHGLYSAALCRRHPQLNSTILDLPPAVHCASQLLSAEGMDRRIRYQPADALSCDLGESAYDLIFVSSLLHHFSEDQNADLCRRIARALRPGGLFVIQEFLRPSAEDSQDVIAAVLDLFFSLTSRSGTWCLRTMTGWQQQAGLKPLRTLYLRSMPGFAQIVARKTSGHA